MRKNLSIDLMTFVYDSESPQTKLHLTIFDNIPSEADKELMRNCIISI